MQKDAKSNKIILSGTSFSSTTVLGVVPIHLILLLSFIPRCYYTFFQLITEAMSKVNQKKKSSLSLSLLLLFVCKCWIYSYYSSSLNHSLSMNSTFILSLPLLHPPLSQSDLICFFASSAINQIHFNNIIPLIVFT